MKNKKILAVYGKIKFTDYFKLYFFKITGYKVYYWSKKNGKKYIPFPDSSKWTPLMLKSRELLSKFFSNKF